MADKMSLQEFIDLGLLQEVNRRFFHPVGLAMAVEYPEDPSTTSFTVEILDDRKDPEGFIFNVPGGDDKNPVLPRPEAIDIYDQMVKAGSRQVQFGWVIQPAGPPQPATTFTVVETKRLPKSLGPIPEGHAKVDH